VPGNRGIDGRVLPAALQAAGATGSRSGKGTVQGSGRTRRLNSVQPPMKELLAVLLGLTYAVVNVVTIFHGKAWARTGSGWSWHLPVAFLAGGGAFVAQSYLSLQEASHLFMAFVDGVLVVGTVRVLYLIFREPTSRMQWVGVAPALLSMIAPSREKC